MGGARKCTEVRDASVGRLVIPASYQRSGDERQSGPGEVGPARSEEHTSELQPPCNLACRLLLEKKNRSILSQTETNELAIRQAHLGGHGGASVACPILLDHVLQLKFNCMLQLASVDLRRKTSDD